MTYKERIIATNEAYLKAQDPAEVQKYSEQLDKLMSENPEEYGKIYLEISRGELEELKDLNVKLRLAEISKIISLSYIAEKYFGKSKSWLSQRINEHSVNGKQVKFSPAEIQKLNYAINDIGRQLGSFSF